MNENTKLVLLALVGVINSLGSAYIGYLVGRTKPIN